MLINHIMVVTVVTFIDYMNLVKSFIGKQASYMKTTVQYMIIVLTSKEGGKN